MSDLDKLRRVLDHYVPLLKSYQNEDEGIKKRINLILNELGQNAYPLLKITIKDDNSYIRSWSSYALSELKENVDDIIPDISILLYDSDPGVRGQTIDVLEKIGTKRAIEALISNLKKHPNDIIAGWIVRSLVRLNVKEIIPYLKKLLKSKKRIIKGKIYKMNKDSPLLFNVREALLKFGDKESTSVIIKDTIEYSKRFNFESIDFQAFPYLKEMFPKVTINGKRTILSAYSRLGLLQLTINENEKIIDHLIEILEDQENDILLDSVILVLSGFGIKAKKATHVILNKRDSISKEKLESVMKQLNPDKNLFDYVYRDANQKDSLEYWLERLEELDYRCINNRPYVIDWDSCLRIIEEIKINDPEKALELLIEIKDNITSDLAYERIYTTLLAAKILAGLIAVDKKTILSELKEYFILCFKYLRHYEKGGSGTPSGEEEVCVELLKLINSLDPKTAINIALEYTPYYFCTEFIDYGAPYFQWGEKLTFTATEILVKNKTKKGIQRLITSLESSFENICALAARGLGEFGDKTAIPSLIECVSGYRIIDLLNEEGDYYTNVLYFFPKLKEEVRIALDKFGVEITDEMLLRNELKARMKGGELELSSSLENYIENLQEVAIPILTKEIFEGIREVWHFDTAVDFLESLDEKTKKEIYNELKTGKYPYKAYDFIDLLLPYETNQEEHNSGIFNSLPVKDETNQEEKELEENQEIISEEVMIKRIRKIIGVKDQVALKYIEVLTKYSTETIKKIVKEDLGFKIIKGDIFQYEK